MAGSLGWLIDVITTTAICEQGTFFSTDSQYKIAMYSNVSWRPFPVPSLWHHSSCTGGTVASERLGTVHDLAVPSTNQCHNFPVAPEWLVTAQMIGSKKWAQNWVPLSKDGNIQLPSLIHQTCKLNCTQLIKILKICFFIVKKLNLWLPELYH